MRAAADSSIQLRDTRYTHDPAVLAAQHALVAVNSAIEVDLTGQANIEVAAGRYVGARRRSRRVPARRRPVRGRRPGDRAPLDGGAAAAASWPPSAARSALARADAGVIVTEYGVADLRGLTLARRRERMIAIAHPDRRAALEAAAAGAAADD